jgi:hypothetical protein
MYLQRELRVMREWEQSCDLVSKRRNFFRSSFVSPIMDSFLDNGYDLPYNTNPRFSQSSERTYLNHGQASGVSITHLALGLC